MFRFKATHLALLLGLIAPVSSFAAHYCIEVNGGFGAPNYGTTFIGTGFSVPSEGSCAPWSGFTKTASTVVLTTSGVGCLSSDGKVLTVSVSSADPDFVGAGRVFSDYIQLCLKGASNCPIGSSNDNGGYFNGPAAAVSCSSSLETLPSKHD